MIFSYIVIFLNYQIWLNPWPLGFGGNIFFGVGEGALWLSFAKQDSIEFCFIYSYCSHYWPINPPIVSLKRDRMSPANSASLDLEWDFPCWQYQNFGIGLNRGLNLEESSINHSYFFDGRQRPNIAGVWEQTYQQNYMYGMVINEVQMSVGKSMDENTN